MADVTINNLIEQAPTNTDVFPFSTTGGTPSTYKATLSQIRTALSIPPAQVNSDWNATSGVSQILNKPSIPTTPLFTSSQVYTGTGTFTVPSGVTSLRILCIGGGGGAKCDCGASSSTQGGTGGTSQVTLGGGRSITATGGGGGNTGIGGGVGSMANAATNLQTSTGRASLNADASTNSGFAKTIADFISPLAGSAGSTTGCRAANGSTGGLAWGIFNVTPGETASVAAGGAGGAYAYQCTASSGTAGVVLIEW